jgi:FkbM family methyltransferase
MLIVKYAKFLPPSIKQHLIQIGAHFGHEAKAYEEAGFSAIAWIEADPDIFKELSVNISKCHNSQHTVHNALITSSSGSKHQFYRYSNQGASNSLYLPTDIFKQSFEGVNLTENVIELQSVSLDEFIATNNINPSALVIDVQGAEMEVFKGGSKALDLASIVEVEISTRQVYDGGAEFLKVDEYLKSFGFLRITHVPWHGDVIYIKPEQLPLSRNLGLLLVSLQYASEYYAAKIKRVIIGLFTRPQNTLKKAIYRLTKG